MIVALTPNPALDVTYIVPGFTPGESHRVDAPNTQAGGKGINTARVIRQQGGRVVAVTTSGGSSGDQFEADLTASGIEFRAVRVNADTRRTITILDTSGHTATVLNEQGGNIDSSESSKLLDELESALGLPEVRCFAGSGSLPPGMPPDVYAQAVTISHALGIASVIDATGPALLAAAESGATVVKANRAEIEATTGQEDPTLGAQRLFDAGARLVLVSLGAGGMLALGPDGTLHAALPRALKGNPTGAGDAATAAIATAISEGEPTAHEMLTRATVWSAAAVLMPHAGAIADNLDELAAALIVTKGMPCP